MEFKQKKLEIDCYSPIPSVFPNNLSGILDYRASETPPYDSGYISSQKDQQDMKVAGVKIFASIMLRAWRRRREDVKHLLKKLEDLQKGSMKTKNQIHVYNTLFHVEQKRNDDLTVQLNRSIESIYQARTSCESLTTSIISLKADKAVLEQELQSKYKEIEALNTILSQTKGDLFRSMKEQRNLQLNLCKEQRTIQFLESQKNKLINEICELGNSSRASEERHRVELSTKDGELQSANDKLRQLSNYLNVLNEKAFQLQEYRANDDLLKGEIETLRKQVGYLQHALDETLSMKLYELWNHVLFYQKRTLQMAHLFAFYLLPATPPPAKFTVTSNISYS